MSQRNEFAKAITVLCITFGKEANKELLRAYWVALEDLETSWPSLLKKSLKVFDRMPVPKQLIELASTELNLSGRQEGILLAGKLKDAVSKYGYNNFELAKKELKPEVWELAQKFGSWSKACKLDFKNSSTNAQVRDFAEIVFVQEKNNKAKFDDSAILNGSTPKDTQENIKQLGDIINEELTGTEI